MKQVEKWVLLSIELKPIDEKVPAMYTVPIIIMSTQDNSVYVEHNLKVKIVSYVVQPSLTTPSVIDPTKETNFKTNIRNRNNVVLEELEIILKSEFFELKETINLQPYETKTIDFIVSFEGAIEQGKLNTELLVYSGEELIGKSIEEINIGSSPNVIEIITPESGFLVNKIEVLKENNGGVINHEAYTITLSFFEKLFTSTNPERTNII